MMQIPSSPEVSEQALLAESFVLGIGQDVQERAGSGHGLLHQQLPRGHSATCTCRRQCWGWPQHAPARQPVNRLVVSIGG